MTNANKVRMFNAFSRKTLVPVFWSKSKRTITGRVLEARRIEREAARRRVLEAVARTGYVNGARG